MEIQTASVHSTRSLPRLRVTRHTTSPNSHTNDGPGPSVTPRPSDFKHPSSHLDSQTTSEDESGKVEYAGATSRLLSASLPPSDSSPDSSVITHRLRAVLNRFDHPSRTTPPPRVVMPPSPSEPESDFDLRPAQAARASIKDLFQNALREPGDTPQKPKPTRRASFNAVGSPKVNKSRRKSTSDEEREILFKRFDEHRSDLSAAASLDRLRLQLTESMPSVQDASSVASASRPPSETTVSTPKRGTPSHLPRLSKIPISHSPMDHAKSHKDLEPFTSVNTEEHSDMHSSQRRIIPSGHIPRSQTPTRASSSLSHTPPVKGSTSATAVSPGLNRHGTSLTSSAQSDADYRERLRILQHETDVERERDWNRRHVPPIIRSRMTSSDHLRPSAGINTGRVSPGAWPTPPPPGSSPSSARSPRHSFNIQENGSDDGHSEDDARSSRSTSAYSNAEYRDRLKEAEREHQRELERSWNRPQPRHSQSAPHMHGENPDSRDVHPSGSSLGHVHSHSHSRPHSRAARDYARSVSPSSSTSSSSHREEVLAEQHEGEHERKQNWNAVRPKRGQHAHHQHNDNRVDHHHFPTTLSPVPVVTNGQEERAEHGRHRTRSSPSSNSTVNGHSHPRPHPRTHHDTSRPHSSLSNRHEGSRSESPSSSTSTHSLREEEVEELHERECNWNAPRPKWEQHSHPHHHHHPHSHEPPLHRSHEMPSPLRNASIDREQEHEWGRHSPNYSLGVHTNGRSSRPASPNLQPYRHSSTAGAEVPIRLKSPVPSSRPSGTHHPRPNSPLPPLTNEIQHMKDNEVAHDINWNSPKVSSSHRHERTPSSPSPTPSRSGPRTSNQGSWGRVGHGSLSSAPKATGAESPPSSPSNHAATDPEKRHRRTTTELSESMGSFPKQNNFPSSLMVLDDSHASLFADESVPPPQMSTPTFNAVHLPDLTISPVPSDIPLPPSPASSVNVKRDSTARADADLARLQRAVAPNFTFPSQRSSPPLPVSSPSASSLAAPPREPSVNPPNFQSRKLSTPVELPESAGPPSSEVDEVNTPVRANRDVVDSLTTMKTPRLPGAFGTPAPSSPLPHVDGSASSQDDAVALEDVEITPRLEPVDAVSLNHDQTGVFNSVSLTPAPPGAYRATPTPAKRKGILKVRFDNEVQTPEGQVDEHASGAVGIPNGIVSKVQGSSSPLSPSSDDVPPLSLSPSRRKGLRLVDEYGRARRFTEDGEEIMLDTRRKGVPVVEALDLVADETTMTPRRRAKMRQVDAFGNEVTSSAESKSTDKPNEKVPESRRKKAVFSRLAKSLGELQDDLAEEEDALAASVPASDQRDNERLMDLATVSKAARVERNKLARKLQLERHAESGTGDKIFVARNPARDLSSETTSERASWWQRKWQLAIIIIGLELILLWMGYRVALVHAKHVWLKTYFDPFFPALYLHKSRPSFLSRFGPLPVDWSAFAISGAIRRVGVRGFVVGAGKRLWEEIWSWRSEPWEAGWASPAAGPPVPRPWPS